MKNVGSSIVKKNKTSLIAKAIQKYGKENFSFEILEECLIEQLDQKEDFYIKYYNSIVPNGYNIIENNVTNRHSYNKYDKNTLLQIIFDIKNTSLSFIDISKKYNLDISMIYYLNRGDYHYNPKQQYPLRAVKNFSKQHWFCKKCGKEISRKAQYCVQCSHIQQRVTERPSREELKFLIRKYSFVELGKKYNVSDNAIKKWCKNEQLPYKKKDIKQYTEQEWLQL